MIILVWEVLQKPQSGFYFAKFIGKCCPWPEEFQDPSFNLVNSTKWRRGCLKVLQQSCRFQRILRALNHMEIWCSITNKQYLLSQPLLASACTKWVLPPVISFHLLWFYNSHHPFLCSPMKKGWERWSFSAWRGEGSRTDLRTAFQYLSGVCKRAGEGLFRRGVGIGQGVKLTRL